MINKKFQNLIDDLQAVHMTVEEKTQLKNRVLLSVEKTEAVLEVDSLSPVSIKKISHGANMVGRSVVSSWYSYFTEGKFVPAFAVLLILVSTGGVSIAAEHALPGDSLYSLKLNLNEQVRGLAAITPEAKAKFALEVTDRRLKEAALLSSQGRLDAKATGIIQEQLLIQAGQVKNQVASLVATNNLQAAQGVALNFESALKTHEFILQKLSDDKGTSTAAQTSESDHISSIIATVRTELATTTTSRTDLQTKELSAPSNIAEVTGRLVSLRADIVELSGLIKSTPLTVAASSTVNLYTTQANDLAVVAAAKIQAGDSPDALTDIQKASQYVSDAEAIIYAITVDPNSNKNIGPVIQSALSSSTTLPISTITSDSKATIEATSTASTTMSIATTTDAVATSTNGQVK
jgi:hypothetical protein